MNPYMHTAGGNFGGYVASQPCYDDPGMVQRVEEDKVKFSRQTEDERRNQYKCGNNYITLEDIITWPQYVEHQGQKLANKGQKAKYHFNVNEYFNGKISIWTGDITTLEIDAIANPANANLSGRLGKGGVDGCIHRAAGKELKRECALLYGCETGDAKITLGYRLPAKYVIHTVGPKGENPGALESCYARCLQLLKENHLKSIAIPCISTGKFGYPKHNAAHVALSTIRTWLEREQNADLVDRIILCLFMEDDIRIYEDLMQLYFPLAEVTLQEEASAYEGMATATPESFIMESAQTSSMEDID